MNIYLLLLFLPSILVVAITKFRYHETVTWKEATAQFIVPLLVVSVVWNVSRYSATSDTEIWNGKVTGKEKEWVSCSHSYDCNCRTVTSGSGKNQTTSRVCDTCYEHNNDWDWNVTTTLGTFEVHRIDSRGSYEPPRWTKVQVGQPVAEEHNYTNWIRGAPDSLFHLTAAQVYKGKLPDYPSVYDYHYIDRVIPVGVVLSDREIWNDVLSRSLNDLGKQKQVNVNLILTNHSAKFADALKTKWLGGKKNDITVVIGTSYPIIKWVRVFSWSKQDIINVSLRSDLIDSKTLNPDITTNVIVRNIAKYYERRPMEDFAYLADEIEPPLWVMILAALLSIAAAIGLGVYFHENDVF